MTVSDDPESTEVVEGAPWKTRSPTPERLLGVTLAGRFECLSILGQGSTGTVYRAIQNPLDRPVAIKVCWIQDDYSGDRVARFLTEASLAGGLQHPNVVTVHDFGRTDDGACYMVMELLEGASLRSQMDGAPMPVRRCLMLFDQILSGLRHAHVAGLVHRDIKPGNIQVVRTDDGLECVKLLDFGLVQRDGEGVPEGEKGTFVGTPHYASPEQVRGEAAGPRSDLYAVGVMMYRALTGCLPFDGATAMAIARAQVKSAYPPMKDSAPGVYVDPGLEAIVRRAMAKEPERRFADAGAMRQAIRDWAVQHGMGFSSAYSSPEPESMELDTVHPTGRGWGVVALATLALGAIGVSWWMTPDQSKTNGEEEVATGIQQSVESEVASQPMAQTSALLDEEEDSRDFERNTTEILEVSVQINSRPSGAQVMFGGELLGVTPFDDVLEIRSGPSAKERRFHLRLEGYQSEVLDMDLSKGSAVGQVQMKPESPKRPIQNQRDARVKGPVQSTDHRQVVEGVDFTKNQAVQVLERANEWSLVEMQAIGIRTQQGNAVVRGRPYLDLMSLSEAMGVGPKTLKALRDAE